MDNELVKASAQLSAAALGYSTLKKLQEEVIVQFLTVHDVFAVLPTGFGKSLCYGCLPTSFDRLRQRTGLS